MRRISQLDGFRAFAVGLVVANHTVPWLAGGGIGVSIFFVLSGYLITTLLLGEWEKTGRISRRKFYLRRALRLYPALLVMLAVTMAVGGVTLKAVLIAATFTSNLAMTFRLYSPDPYGHTWSLAVQEQFYLIWPLLLPLAARLGRRVMVMSLVFLSVGSALWAQLAIGPLIGKHGSLWQVHGLLLGCALAFAIAHRPVRRPELLTNAGLSTCVILAVAATVTVAWQMSDIWSITSELAAAAAIAGLRERALGLGRLLTLRPVLWIGSRSYAIYLWHVPLITLALAHGYGRRGAVIAVALSVCVAGLSWRLVEQPFLRLKSRAGPATPKDASRQGTVPVGMSES